MGYIRKTDFNSNCLFFLEHFSRKKVKLADGFKTIVQPPVSGRRTEADPWNQSPRGPRPVTPILNPILNRETEEYDLLSFPILKG